MCLIIHRTSNLLQIAVYKYNITQHIHSYPLLQVYIFENWKTRNQNISVIVNESLTNTKKEHKTGFFTMNYGFNEEIMIEGTIMKFIDCKKKIIKTKTKKHIHI